jgi:lipopolysaccharide transport system ATP-binding protein
VNLPPSSDMAGDVVIRAEGLGKKYRIGHTAERERYVALRDVLARGARTAWRKTADLARGRAVLGGGAVEEFWALRDVSFEVRRGEALGIIGRNGAGKTTLLKILSRITEPSEGRVAIRGRIASLLEVGTGFHPELTGRENIYLNGAILGMTRAEIRRKFDAIVAFAEVERFLDTPVKRYSSGMYVRLAFAVAAHLEPDILVVDEVLAVGDAEFQKRCLGKMSEVAGGGRTVLFVSHNLSAVASMCARSILLDHGKAGCDGATPLVMARYVSQAYPAREAAEWSWQLGREPGTADLRLLGVRIRGESSPGPVFSPEETLDITIAYLLRRELTGARVGLQLETPSGQIAFTATDQGVRRDRYPSGVYESICRIPGGLLNRMTYLLRVWAGIPGQRQLIEPVDVGCFVVEGAGNERSLYHESAWPGAVCPRLEWMVRSRKAEAAVVPPAAAQ